MRVPQVSERIKEAPAQALRGVFAGIGQLLLITDKLRNKTPASQQVPRARTPESSEKAGAASAAPPASAAPAAPAAAPASAAPVAPSAPAAERVTEARDFDKTGNVRLLTGTQAAAGSVAPTVDAAAADAPVTAAADAPVTAAADAPVTAAAEPAMAAEPSTPWPNYDELSIASLRARLRNLDVAQLRQLVEYEQAHANRADVVAMFTRRIAKLQAETTPEERGEAEAAAEIESQEDVEAEVQSDESEAVEDES